MPSKIECPKCQGPLTVWLDIDAALLFSVSRTGKLSKRAIEDNTQSDGRCGLKCQACSWKVLGSKVEDEALLQVIRDADDALSALELKVVPRKH